MLNHNVVEIQSEFKTWEAENLNIFSKTCLYLPVLVLLPALRKWFTSFFCSILSDTSPSAILRLSLCTPWFCWLLSLHLLSIKDEVSNSMTPPIWPGWCAPSSIDYIMPPNGALDVHLLCSSTCPLNGSAHQIQTAPNLLLFWRVLKSLSPGLWRG